MSKFTENKSEDIKGAGNVLWYAFLAVVVFGIIGWGVWYFTVATSDIVGKGNQTIENNSSTNRTYQYNKFLALDATIRTQSLAAEVSRKALARFETSHPKATEDSFTAGQQRGELEGNATGAEQICLANVNEYNNSVKSFLAAKYVDSKLPDSFSTDVCQDPSKLPASISGQ